MIGQHDKPASTESFEFDALQKAVNYRRVLVREFSPFLKARVLEIGAGIGQVTAALAAAPGIDELVSVEPEARFCEVFRKQHPGRALVHGTIDALAGDSNWNAVVSINVLEHIPEDEEELAKYRQALSSRSGHLCLFVPARREIYAPIDRDFGHCRRYHRPDLRQKLARAGFSVVRLDYFNLVGYFAWWLNFCLLRQRRFDVPKVVLFDRFVFPVAHAFERFVFRPPIGQSLLAVARASR